jgi:hypothetical protein
MPDFLTLDYLQSGNAWQRLAYVALLGVDPEALPVGSGVAY